METQRSQPADKKLRTIIQWQRELSIHTICDFPPELLARTVKFLAYFDILRAGMVCKLLNAIVREDPEIAELLHKRTCRSMAGCPFELCGETESSEAAVVHPALQFMSYCMGEEIETAAIFRSGAETDTHPNSLQKFPIIELGNSARLRYTPYCHTDVHQITKRVQRNGPGRRELSTRGASTVLDGLQAIVRECAVTYSTPDFGMKVMIRLVIDSPVLTLPRTSDGLVTDDMVGQAFQAAFTSEGVRRGKWLNKAHCLEGFRRYEGLEAVRKGLRVNAVMILGSQPSEDEFFRPKADSEISLSLSFPISLSQLPHPPFDFLRKIASPQLKDRKVKRIEVHRWACLRTIRFEIDIGHRAITSHALPQAACEEARGKPRLSSEVPADQAMPGRMGRSSCDCPGRVSHARQRHKSSRRHLHSRDACMRILSVHVVRKKKSAPAACDLPAVRLSTIANKESVPNSYGKAVIQDREGLEVWRMGEEPHQVIGRDEKFLGHQARERAPGIDEQLDHTLDRGEAPDMQLAERGSAKSDKETDGNDEYRKGLDRLDADHRSGIRECAQVEAAGGLEETEGTDLGDGQERMELQQVAAAAEFERMQTRGVPDGETVAEGVECGKFAVLGSNAQMHRRRWQGLQPCIVRGSFEEDQPYPLVRRAGSPNEIGLTVLGGDKYCGQNLVRDPANRGRMKRLRRDDMPTYGTLLLEGSLLRIQGAEVCSSKSIAAMRATILA
ncbi:hypothetical protein B0H13DRAFT_1915807 [Mycena leptocephala]|nr:hypothetical protein B0H13DRAFT_1915807 [Mycena leptocephala]